MNKQWVHIFLAAALALLLPGGAFAAKREIPQPLKPVSVMLQDDKVETVYPSVAGGFLVYTKREKNEFSVVRVPVGQPAATGRVIAPEQPHEAIRYGVAVKGGAIGYISNRMGPIAAWMRQGHGDGHIAIANMGTFTGALMPANLRSSADGRIWCFDTSLEGKRRARVLDDFNDGFQHEELVGQTWRYYNSEAWRYKQIYLPVRTGLKNEFQQPSLFTFDRTTSQLMMIPEAFDGALSPDGKRIAFVRERSGNYDLWMQNVDGSDLVQLTTDEYGEFEPVFSPDGKRIAFVSNRDSEGDVRATSIYVMDLESGRSERLTNALEATDGGPAWLDDHTIIFHSNRSPDAPQAKADAKWNLWKVELK